MTCKMKPQNQRWNYVVIADKAMTYLKRHPQMLPSLSPHFTPQAASYLLLSSQSDKTTILNFLQWAQPQAQAQAQHFFTPHCMCLSLHILTRFKLYRTAHSLAADLAATLPDPTALFRHLLHAHHVSSSSSSAAFDLVIKTLSHLNLVDKALIILHLSHRHGFSLTVLSYNSILHALLTRASLHTSHLFLLMLRYGVSPNVYTYNIMIRAFVAKGDLQRGLGFMEKMERHGISPNVVTFNTLIDGSCKMKKVNVAMKLLRTMLARGVAPSLISYNSVINGLCSEGRITEAMEMVEEMSRRGLVPDEVTYNTLVNGYCKEGNFHQGLVLVEEMVGKGLSPNVVTYTTLINCMCKAGNLNRVREIFDQMRVRGLRPNERTYTTLIDGFCQQGLLNEAYKVLSEMIVCGFSPSMVTYNALIHGYCFLGRVEEAVGLLRGMVGRGLCPDVFSYSTVIAGFCQERELGKAFQVKEEMVEKGVLPDAVTYSSLIQGLCLQQKLVEAFDLFREMVRRGLLPDEVTYTSLINAYCVEGELSKALRLHNEMMQKGFLPDDVTYSVLIDGLNKKARTKEAKRLLLKLFYEESVPNDVTYNTLIENCNNNEFKSAVSLVKGFCMKGLMSEADRVFKTMLQRNHKPNAAIYNLIIHGHCRSGNVHKAYDLYMDLEHCDFVPHTVTVIALVKALAREGMNDELGRVLENILRSCKLNEAEVAKVLVEVNFKEGNMDAVLNVLTEMAKDGLLPDGGKCSYAPPKTYRRVSITTAATSNWSSVDLGSLWMHNDSLKSSSSGSPQGPFQLATQSGEGTSRTEGDNMIDDDIKVEDVYNGEGFASAVRTWTQSIMLEYDKGSADAAVRHVDWGASKVRDKLHRDIDLHASSVRSAKLSEITSNFEKKLAKALTQPVESLLEAGGKDTWLSIRELLKRETEAAISEFSASIAGFELDEETIERMQQSLRDYARKLVENKAREEAGKILIRTKDR